MCVPYLKLIPELKTTWVGSFKWIKQRDQTPVTEQTSVGVDYF